MKLFAAPAMLVALLLTASPVLAQDSGFTAAQKAEIGKVIQDYIMENPKLVLDAVEKYRANQEEIEAQAMLVAIKEKASEIYNDPTSPATGNPKGDVTLVEFFDYNCGYCKVAFKDVQTLVAEDKNLKVVFKDIPILGETSLLASRYALAAGKQNKYWEYHTALMSHQGAVNEGVLTKVAETVKLDVKKLKADADSAEVRAKIEKNLELARALGITGTPAFIVADKALRGHYGVDALRKAISEGREKKAE